MKVIDIVMAHLETNGFDGLFSVDGECGCELGDLMPCGEYNVDCEAGYRIAGCQPGCGEGCDFHIMKNKGG
jgi:hypothetical protein